jgi:4-hydroxy-3-methylbut-2-enyl diphosphate reductase
MTVTIDPSAGFCWGVVRTIAIAEEEIHAGREIMSLGDVIHNPMEIERLGKKGLRTVTVADFVDNAGKRVMVRAHGEPPETYRLAEEHGIEIIDATCPVVTRLQERIRKFHLNGYQVVIFGKVHHPEVIGLRGVCNDECIVALTLDDVRNTVDLRRKTVLFSQTTMDKPTFVAIRDHLKQVIAHLIVESAEDVATEFHAKETICGQVSGRDKKLTAYSRDNDVVVFVAGRTSSNGKVLFDIAMGANANTHFVERIDELDPSWFANARSVGISGATSTPMWLMEQVRAAILAIASVSVVPV